PAAVVRRTGGRTAATNVSSAGRAAGMDPEARWVAKAPRHPHGQRPGRADGCFGGLGAHLRGRLAAGAVRLSTGARRLGCPAARAYVAEHGLPGGGGGGPGGL